MSGSCSDPGANLRQSLMLIAIRRQTVKARRRLGTLLALGCLIGALVVAHSACAGPSMDMDGHHSMSDAVALCLFLVETGAVALGVMLAARILRRRGWRLPKPVDFIGAASLAAPLTPALAPARAGPLLQVFRL